MQGKTAVPRTPQQAKFLAEHRRAFRKASDAWARAQGCTHRITETGQLQPLGSSSLNGRGTPPPNGRAPREAHNDHQRGSRRGARASSSSSDDPGDDGESSEPPPRRYCENERCQADITHLGTLARYCANAGACKQQAYRGRRTLEHLDEISGTTAEGLSCVCEPQRSTLEPGHYHQCGYTRGVVTREWVTERGASSRQLVVLGSARHKPRCGDGKRKPVHEYKVPRGLAA
jgi:hypothetical protein